MTGVENQNQTIQRPRASSPASKKDVINVGSPKAAEKPKESATKKVAPEAATKSFVTRVQERPQALLSLAMSMVVMVCLIGAYFDVAVRIPVGKEHIASPWVAAPIVGAASIFICKKFLPLKVK